jgi:hypothetical protein
VQKSINPCTYLRHGYVWSTGGEAPYILNLGARLTLLVTFTFLLIYARGKSSRTDLIGWVQFTADLGGEAWSKITTLPPPARVLCINQDNISIRTVITAFPVTTLTKKSAGSLTWDVERCYTISFVNLFPTAIITVRAGIATGYGLDEQGGREFESL